MPAYNEKKISIHSPATVANLVSGFDVMGLALSEPQDWMSMRLLTEPVIRIKHLDAFGLSEQPGENVAGAVLLAIQRDQGGTIGFEIEINKHIKPGSGIGSSAASAAGAAVGANYLLGNPYSPTELVKWAMEGEYVASGSRHPDNVTPGIFGGVTLVRSADPLDIIPLDYPNLFVALVHPQVEVKTADARNILSPTVTLKQAIRQWGNLGALVAGFLKKDYDLIARSLEDHIVEPQRKVLIPGYDAVKVA
ncbi:MAG TPA: homoserine kinase, partial [Ferruginibacter sp.]|nr:homoserine kinase [Ferruginibacter sp.]